MREREGKRRGALKPLQSARARKQRAEANRRNTHAHARKREREGERACEKGRGSQVREHASISVYLESPDTFRLWGVVRGAVCGLDLEAFIHILDTSGGE